MHGVGNEYSVLQMMIAHAKEARDKHNLKTSARLALHYCGVLKGASRNRDLRVAALGLLRLLEHTDLDDEICDLNRFCGRACRLTNHDEEAVTHFQASLEHDKGKPSRESRAYALLEVIDSLRNTGNLDAALDSAKQVKALSKAGTLLESQAEFKLTSLKPESPDKLGAVIAMEKKARTQGWTSHANDLSMSIYSELKDTDQKFKIVDSVLTSDEGGWNRHRAIVEKAILAVRENAVEKLSMKDRIDLADAYTYCHSQRLGMFNRCHEALWSVLEREGEREGLYRLFRHSSFIWRIRGEDDTELRYFERLKSLKDQPAAKASLSIAIEITYFAKRATVLVARLMGASASRNAPSKK
jgi:DNA-directed RNA polymerase subunit F